ncbi:MAG: UDP-N-acetylmuramate dehydrogenase [bacterium]
MKNGNAKCKIVKKLPDIKQNICLAQYAAFKIGGRARYFFIAKTKEDIVRAIRVAKECGLPFFIFGGASNLLFADSDYEGLVIKISNQKLEDKDSTRPECGAGVILSELVNFASRNDLTGLEWAIGIPGTVGGAIRGNAGAFKSSLSEIVTEVEIYDTSKDRIKTFSYRDCQFAYRDSIFKKNPKLIILAAKFKLKKGKAAEIKKKAGEYLGHRQKTQPVGLPSAGSVFKNPDGVSAGCLIEKCGLKERKIGGAEVSAKHANFIVNSGGATAADVKKLMILIKQEVKKKWKIELEEEIQVIDRMI